MRVEIKKGNMANAVIITFRTRSDKFESYYDRNRFFRGLHGWKQVVPREDKKYSYRRKGILDDIPHIKIADSVFMIAVDHLKRMEEFFHEWEEKVECDIMKVFIEKNQLTEKDLFK